MWRGSRAFDDSSSQVQDILEKARQEAKELGTVYMTAIKDALDILPAPSSARSTPRGLTPGPFLTSTMDVKPGHWPPQKDYTNIDAFKVAKAAREAGSPRAWAAIGGSSIGGNRPWTHQGGRSPGMEAMTFEQRPGSSPTFGQSAPSTVRGPRPGTFMAIDALEGPRPPLSPRPPTSPPRSPRKKRGDSPRVKKGGRKCKAPTFGEFVYFESCNSARLHDGSTPWARWPFAPADAGEDTGPAGNPPSGMSSPRAAFLSSKSTKISWDPGPAEDCIAGYEVEIQYVDALRGPQPWKKSYRGPKCTCDINFLRGCSGCRVRVRAYNAHGKGEWSDISPMMKRPVPGRPERKPISELPGKWLAIDLAGLAELSDRNDNVFLAQTKEELLQSLFDNQMVIKIAFRYYALAGVSNVDDDPSTMTMMQFGNFCRGANLLNSALSQSDVDRIFLRAVRVMPPTTTADGKPKQEDAIDSPNLLSDAPTTKVTVGKEWKKLRAAVGISFGAMIGAVGGGNLMSGPQFVGALVRLASHKYPEDSVPLADKLTKICKNHIEDHILVELSLVEDDFNRRLRGHIMGSVLETHQPKLKQIFNAYAAADLSNAAGRRAQATMNVKETYDMCDDVGLFDQQFSVRDLLIAFVKVNIDDDVYEQEQAENSASELVFDEFEEVVARVFVAAVWRHQSKLQDSAALLDQDGDGDLDDDDIDDLFNECDADGSGSISLAELTDALKKRLNEAAAEAVAKQLHDIADEDGSGSMEREELRGAIQKIQRGKGNADPMALEKAFDTWLREKFIPNAQRGMIKKKLPGAVG